MRHNLVLKIAIIVGLMVALLIPLSLIDGVVAERGNYRADAEAEIANMWTESQLLKGPILVAPYSETTYVKVWDKEAEKYISEKRVNKNRIYYFPETLSIDSHVATEERYRGLYKVPVYTADITMSGKFLIPQHHGTDTSREIEWHQPFVTFGVGDLRGIRSSIEVLWQGVSMDVVPGTIAEFGKGARANLDELYKDQGASYDFDIHMALAGTSGLQIIPVGKTTEIVMESDWPHPSFGGRFLPTSREVSDDGFRAEWHVSHFATNIEERFHECADIPCLGFLENQLGVSFINPIDVYSLVDRSIKYGILFIAMTFCVFFMFEVLRKLKIHPVQYGFVGLALAVFYQLLVSLSEHIAFDYAYLVSAVACVSLIGTYVGYILHSIVRGLGMSAFLFILYLMLLMILKSEGHAMLMGSCLIFGVLAALMMLTRHVDWYRFSEQLTNHETQASGPIQ